MSLLDFFRPHPERYRNPWLEAGREWDWKDDDTIYQCLADMTRRIQSLEQSIANLIGERERRINGGSTWR